MQNSQENPYARASFLIKLQACIICQSLKFLIRAKCLGRKREKLITTFPDILTYLRITEKVTFILVTMALFQFQCVSFIVCLGFGKENKRYHYQFRNRHRNTFNYNLQWLRVSLYKCLSDILPTLLPVPKG